MTALLHCDYRPRANGKSLFVHHPDRGLRAAIPRQEGLGSLGERGGMLSGTLGGGHTRAWKKFCLTEHHGFPKLL